jgi:spore germination protein GerM
VGGLLALLLAAGLLSVLDRMREPAPLRYRVDLADRGVGLSTMTVYYLAADSLLLVARELEVLEGLPRPDLARDLVECLADPPRGLRSPLPEGTRLLHYFEDGEGEGILNFNDRITEIDGGSIAEERLRLSAFTRTLADNLPGLTRLRLMVHGRPLTRWGLHLEPGPALEVRSW